SDDAVLLIPATGGVGLAALQTCKKAGATSITTTRSRKKAEKLKDLGADYVIVTTEENLIERVREITDGKGVRIVFNALTGSIIDDLVKATQPSGTIFQYGGIGGKETLLPYTQLIRYGVRIQGYTLYELTYYPENLAEVRKYVSEGIEEGHYTANVGKVFEFDQMIQVHHYLEEGNMSGSVVVRI
ncbi:MAG: zinc-binding dehydrogenase, partial [Waterburya sp.]